MIVFLIFLVYSFIHKLFLFKCNEFLFSWVSSYRVDQVVVGRVFEDFHSVEGRFGGMFCFIL